MSTPNAIAELLIAVRTGRMITSRTLAVGDVDATLDDRELPEFDGEWMRVHAQIGGIPLQDRARAAVEELVAETFKKCYEFENGDQLAPYVSDDFELLARALLLQFDDVWLRQLWRSYAHERFPRGVLEADEAPPIGEF